MYLDIDQELEHVWNFYWTAQEAFFNKYGGEQHIPKDLERQMEDFRGAMHEFECYLKDKSGEELIEEENNLTLGQAVVKALNGLDASK